MRTEQAMSGDGIGDRLDKLFLAVRTPTGITAMFLDRGLDFTHIHLLENPHGFGPRVEFAAAVRTLAVAIVETSGQFFGEIRSAKMPGMSRLGAGFPGG